MTHLFEVHFKEKASFDDLNLEWLVALQRNCSTVSKEAGDDVPALCHADQMLGYPMAWKACCSNSKDAMINNKKMLPLPHTQRENPSVELM